MAGSKISSTASADIIVVLGDLLEDFGALANVLQVFRDDYWVVRDGVV